MGKDSVQSLTFNIFFSLVYFPLHFTVYNVQFENLIKHIHTYIHTELIIAVSQHSINLLVRFVIIISHTDCLRKLMIKRNNYVIAFTILYYLNIA